MRLQLATDAWGFPGTEGGTVSTPGVEEGTGVGVIVAEAGVAVCVGVSGTVLLVGLEVGVLDLVGVRVGDGDGVDVWVAVAVGVWLLV